LLVIDGLGNGGDCGCLADLERIARVKTVSMMLEGLESQLEGYRSLARDYIRTLREDTIIRNNEIRWCADFSERALHDFSLLASQTANLHHRITERYLIRRHNSFLFRQGL